MSDDVSQVGAPSSLSVCSCPCVLNASSTPSHSQNRPAPSGDRAGSDGAFEPARSGFPFQHEEAPPLASGQSLTGRYRRPDVFLLNPPPGAAPAWCRSKGGSAYSLSGPPASNHPSGYEFPRGDTRSWLLYCSGDRSKIGSVRHWKWAWSACTRSASSRSRATSSRTFFSRVSSRPSTDGTSHLHKWDEGTNHADLPRHEG